MPPATVADTWVLVPVRRLCTPLAASSVVGPSGTPTVWGTVDPTVAGGAGLSRWTGRFPLAMGVGALAVGIPHAAAVTISAVVATTARRLRTRRLTTGARGRRPGAAAAPRRNGSRALGRPRSTRS